MYVTLAHAPQCDPQLTCNAEESDTRIWLHVVNSSGQKKLILSPDRLTNCCWFIPWSCGEAESIHITWKQIPRYAGSHQSLRWRSWSRSDSKFTDSSCDTNVIRVYRLWLHFLFQWTRQSFIFINPIWVQWIYLLKIPGTLANIDPTSHGILSFYRLIGCAYFRKHKAAFLPTYPTPMSLFNSLAKDNQTHLDHHSAWLSFLRDRVWSRNKIWRGNDSIWRCLITALAKILLGGSCVEASNTKSHHLPTLTRKWMETR